VNYSRVYGLFSRGAIYLPNDSRRAVKLTVRELAWSPKPAWYDPPNHFQFDYYRSLWTLFLWLFSNLRGVCLCLTGRIPEAVSACQGLLRLSLHTRFISLIVKQITRTAGSSKDPKIGLTCTVPKEGQRLFLNNRKQARKVCSKFKMFTGQFSSGY
jgi:hypothetical protein